VGTPHGPPSRDPGRCFDLVLLGLGADGHTASLFPHSAALAEATAWAIDTPPPVPGPARVTLSLPLLAAGRERLLLVTGASKHGALQASLFGAPDPARWPVQALLERAGTLHVLADAAAGAQASGRV
ncbi:MAG TPA: 6-phosphogluconolactonase, partial [Polyangiales bacterium]